jgi:16S rRNA (cytidine1402-2'-O)-methyltransferase
MTALAISGLSADRVLFLGFLPKKLSKRKESWNLVKAADGLTVIIYESPFRVSKTLEEIRLEFGEQAQTVIARELTKEYEQVLRGTVAELLEKKSKIKGEVVILFRFERP